ncbi:MAG: SBBP repeat-containing protein [Hyphomonas sp.]|nr:SBBP repeat-containing protein [Hyphomonas sp.]
MTRGIVMDSAGAIYITGGASSSDFPVTSGAYDTSFATGGSNLGSEGPMDVFVAKIAANGQLEWATFIGGPNYDRAYAIDLDPSGNVLVAGRAGNGFPTTSGTVQTGYGGDSQQNGLYGGQDGFVAKLSADGGSLLWSTYFGGPSRGFIRDMDVDGQGRPHVGFVSYGSNPHITSDADRGSRQGVVDAGYAILSANGQSVDYATYLGGTSSGGLFTPTPSVRVASDGGAFVSWFDNASNVPTSSNAYQPNLAGDFDMLVSRFSSQQTRLWTTYFGGSRREEVETHGLALTSSDQPVIVGFSDSKDLPTTSGAFQENPGSSSTSEGDGFIAILSSNGQSLVAASYLGGSNQDELEGVHVMADGTIIATGGTRSSFLPTDSNSEQSFNAGGADGMLVQFSSDLSEVRYSTYIGGTGREALRDVTSNASGAIGIAGFSRSGTFPSVNSSDVSVDGLNGAVYGQLTPR